MRNIRWDGAAPLEGFEFIIDDMNETYTFFVPEICGNVSLVRREPSREAARRAEMHGPRRRRRPRRPRRRPTKAAADKAAADKAAADKAAADKAAADKAAADKAAADKAAADKAAADAAAAEAARQAEEARLALERDLRTRPFFAGIRR